MPTIINVLISFFVKIKNRKGLIFFVLATTAISYISTTSDFYWYIEGDIFKQQDKLENDRPDMKVWDVIRLNTYCQKDTFNIYMLFQSRFNQIRVAKVCKILEENYQQLTDY